MGIFPDSQQDSQLDLLEVGLRNSGEESKGSTLYLPMHQTLSVLQPGRA